MYDCDAFLGTSVAVDNSSFGTVPKEIPITYCSGCFSFSISLVFCFNLPGIILGIITENIIINFSSLNIKEGDIFSMYTYDKRLITRIQM